MMSSSAAQVQSETALRNLPAKQVVARVQFIEMRRQRALRHQLQKKFQRVLVRRRHQRVRPLNSLPLVLHSQRGVLPGQKFERSSRIHANEPQIRSKVSAFAY